MSHRFSWRNVAGGVIDGTVTGAIAVALGWDRSTVSDSWPCQHSLRQGPQMCFSLTGVTEVNRSEVTGFTVTDVQSAMRNLSPVLALHIGLQMSRHSTDLSSDRKQEHFLICDSNSFFKVTSEVFYPVYTWSLGWKIGLVGPFRAWFLQTNWSFESFLYYYYYFKEPIFLTSWY